MRSLIQEFKRILKSLIFLGLIVAFVLALVSQLGSKPPEFQEPKPNQETYGIYLTDDLDYIYPNLMVDLKTAVDANYFATYPFGFYREKNLNDSELNAIKAIMAEMAGKPYEEISDNDHLKNPSQAKLELQLEKIDALIGGGSFYASDEYKVHFGKKGMSYEEALSDYHLMRGQGFDLSFARYFSDYAGIFTMLLTWFMGLYLWNKDRKEGVANTLYVKSISSLKLIMTRVLAMSLAILLIILAIFTYYEGQLLFDYGLDLLSPLKAYGLVIAWILPIILFIVSLSSLITIASKSILFGFLGPIFSMVYLMSSSANIYYNIGYVLLLRYNSVGNEKYFISQINTFLIGRTVWLVLAILIIVLTVFLYERRRRGYHAFKSILPIKNRV